MINQEISGTVDRFLFRNEENGYTVLVIGLSDKSTAIAKGYVSNIQPGQSVALSGSWVVHSKFGRQFTIEHYTVRQPETVHGLKKYLGSGLIKGIGKVYAEKLVNHFGIKVLDIIDKEPDRLSEVEGIGQKRIEQIKHAWHDQKEISNLMVFLQDKDISSSYAIKIYKKYGKESIALITQNPYRIAEEIWGIGFRTADALALKLGIEPFSVKRIKAAMLFAINEASTQGHLYCTVQNLKNETLTLLNFTQETTDNTLLKTALHELYDADKIKLISHDNEHYVTLKQFYWAEKKLSEKLKVLNASSSKNIFNIQEVYQKISQGKEHFCLNEDQQHGVMTALQHKVTIITGGPGTGKTTLIKKLLEILDEHQLQYRLAAPTGRAAKRITEGTGRYAVTLHRLLEYDVSTMSFVHNETNALKTDFVIVDEASMIDVFLAHGLLKAIAHSTHILFIGDCDQLPSVGAGNFLNDMIASAVIPTVRLTQIFRQAQDSMIVINAHKINRGEFPASFIPDARKDFFFIKEPNPENVLEHLRKIFFNSLKKWSINQEDVAVLVPMNRGVVGTIKINQDLQALLNDKPAKSIQFGSTVFKVGDRVMQLRNNYDKAVYNGDCGIIEDIEVEDRALKVLFNERVIEYESDELNELTLSYALSIHKSQGSEYPMVVIPLFMQHFMLLQRNLVYTALTRAKKVCIFIGQPQALAMAIKNNKLVERVTLLKQYLVSDLSCR